MAGSLLAPPAAPGLRRASSALAARAPRQAVLEDAAASAFHALETGFAVVGAFLLSHAVVPLLLESSGQLGGTYDGNPILRTMFATVHATSLLMLALHARGSLAALARRPTMAALVLLAIASTAWSAAPELTLRRGFALLGTSAFGVFLASRFTPRELLRVLAATAGLLAVSSLAFAIALPAIGVDHHTHAGAWKGVFTHKNSLGGEMVTGCVAFLLLRLDLPRGRRWIATGGLALCLFLLLMSTSKTALTVLMALFACAALFRMLRWRIDVAIIVVLLAVLVGGSIAAAVVANWETLLTAMGKDPSLTGRVPMWQVLVRTIGHRPVLGYGYNAFWLGHTGPSAGPLREIGWDTPTAHNGFLDTGLQVGLLGLGLFLAGYVTAFRQALAGLRRTVTADGLWPLLIMTMLLLYNATESVLLEKNNLLWALYVCAVCSPLLARPRAAGAAQPAPSASPAPPVLAGVSG